MPPSVYRRFSSGHWFLLRAALRVDGNIAGLQKLFRRGLGQTNEDFNPKCVSKLKGYSWLVPSFVASLPITTAIFVLPRDWFTKIMVLFVLQAFLWWLLLGPVRSFQWVLRRFLGMVVYTGMLVDLGLLVAMFRGHGLWGWSINGTTVGGSILGLTALWGIGLLWALVPHPRRVSGTVGATKSAAVRAGTAKSEPASELRVPKFRFADVGGMEEAKQQIRDLVENRLNPQKYAAYGINRNGILLYGPRGSGKTFLAEATAGEFGLNFHYISPTKFTAMGLGESEAGIRRAFASALTNRPALLFIDEIDALGSARQKLGGGGDPGGGGRSYNNMVIELMQSIDQARREAGVVLMAATNVIEGLDEALIREGRFDVKIRVDLPDEATREKIFEAQLSAKPRERLDLSEYARRTPGASAAKIRSLVDQAAVFAARESRKIEPRDIERALGEYGGKDRPLFRSVEWQDVVVDAGVERELRSLIRLVSNPFAASRMRLHAPTGLLLEGPPGNGRTMIARLIATQSKRSFLPVTSAEITDPKSVSRIFARAKETSPSLIFLDEMDSLLPANPGYLNQYYVQIVEQFLIEISALEPEHNVFLVGRTNHPENIDPRVLRGGRFSEKIEIGPPGRKEINRLLAKYLEGIELQPSLELGSLTDWLTGTTAADLQATVATAKRYAFERSNGDRLAPLSQQDFARAVERVMGRPPLRSARSTQV